MMKPTVIITGSGVSAQYDFPTGSELISKKILPTLLDQSLQSINKNKGHFLFGYSNEKELQGILDVLCFTESEKCNLMSRAENFIQPMGYLAKPFCIREMTFIKEFIEGLSLFKNSQIDYFLRNRGKFRELGQLLITKAILDAEKNAIGKINYNQKPGENWIGCLIAKIFENVRKPEDLRVVAKNLTIVTFNYDISLEYYLDLICKGDDEWENEIQEFKKNLKIVHVYGRVGVFDWEAGLDDIYDEEIKKSFFVRSHGFGSILDYDTSYKISKGIQVIDGLKNSNDLKHIKFARNKIKDANRIFFLGFGFDKNNLDYLGIDGSDNASLNGKDIFYTNHDNSEYIKLIINEKKIKAISHVDRNSQDIYNNVQSMREANDLLKLYL